MGLAGEECGASRSRMARMPGGLIGSDCMSSVKHGPGFVFRKPDGINKEL